MKEPQKFIGIEKKFRSMDSEMLWMGHEQHQTLIKFILEDVEELKKSQTIVNYIMGFSLVLSVSTLVTIYLFKI